MNRRRYLKSMGLGAAALALSGCSALNKRCPYHIGYTAECGIAIGGSVLYAFRFEVPVILTGADRAYNFPDIFGFRVMLPS